MPGMVLSGNGETALRLGAALLLGAIFGLNRESHGKPAGLRTSRPGLPGSGSLHDHCAQIAQQFPGCGANAISRVVQGILTGVGFWVREKSYAIPPATSPD
jgi:putative Mg2+ transporter-C (MgtC) family protein